MRFSIITPNYNSGRFLEQTLASVIAQTADGIELEYIVVDGGSTDNSHAIIARHADKIAKTIIEKDNGPANAINKGLVAATGDVLAWLNADDIYYPSALRRVREVFEQQRPDAAICFGGCPIVDAQGQEIRTAITRFKEFFYPISSRFTYQCINYLSQPALFFRRSAFEQAGPLREDMRAAWDYEFILRLWRGTAAQVPGGPLAAFRWHEQSISGQHFARQFQEEYEAARADAGRLAPQTLLHYCVRWSIVGIYSLMARRRKSCA